MFKTTSIEKSQTCIIGACFDPFNKMEEALKLFVDHFKEVVGEVTNLDDLRYPVVLVKLYNYFAEKQHQTDNYKPLDIAESKTYNQRLFRVVCDELNKETESYSSIVSNPVSICISGKNYIRLFIIQLIMFGLKSNKKEELAAAFKSLSEDGKKALFNELRNHKKSKSTAAVPNKNEYVNQTQGSTHSDKTITSNDQNKLHILEKENEKLKEKVAELRAKIEAGDYVENDDEDRSNSNSNFQVEADAKTELYVLTAEVDSKKQRLQALTDLKRDIDNLKQEKEKYVAQYNLLSEKKSSSRENDIKELKKKLEELKLNKKTTDYYDLVNSKDELIKKINKLKQLDKKCDLVLKGKESLFALNDRLELYKNLEHYNNERLIRVNHELENQMLDHRYRAFTREMNRLL